MITAVLAGIFYAISPELGIVVALVTPAVMTLDMNGDYAEVVIEVFWFLAMFFMRRQIEEN